ncbi:MAG: histidine phosphatase family protein [Candidatus Woesearchaeota archaeon]|nr:histidine phosphatase family protein [Candidatus Woesearchaeota archaeon]
MDYLLVVRHGEYDNNTGQLTTPGEHQIESLADKVQSILGIKQNKTTILSSQTQRTKQSAKIIAKIFGLPVEEIVFSKSLFPDGEDLSSKRAKELNILRTQYQDSQLLVMVGHIDVANGYPEWVLQEREVTYSQGKIEKGQGVLINLMTNAYQVVP